MATPREKVSSVDPIWTALRQQAVEHHQGGSQPVQVPHQLRVRVEALALDGCKSAGTLQRAENGLFSHGAPIEGQQV